MRTEVRLAGFGGQGIVLAGAILGEAAIVAGLEAVQTQSFGPEARGGAARSEVIISDAPVDYPCVTIPDILVALSTESMRRYGREVSGRTRIVLDADLVQLEVEGAERLPFTATAETLGRKIVANIVMLGYVTRRFDLVPREHVEGVVLRRIPKGSEELNARALQAGWELAAGTLGTGGGT